MDRRFKFQLPNKSGANIEIETSQSVLIIGANGSGKTRLGTWIEMHSPQKSMVHRISAQKSLAMPDNATPMAIDKAEKALLYGHADAPDEGGWNHKQQHKWQKKPATAMLNDYQKLMVYLFSEHTEESAKYLQASKESEIKVQPPTTKLDLVKAVWERVLPHRELILGGLRILTCVRDQKEKTYNSSEMSDGERVIFYLVGQCLAAPRDGIIIIDEPEIHLHKSVQIPLWREIENLRPDCLFVYMTHDVEFAASFHESKKIWLKSYDGTSWEWEEVFEVEGLPEALLVEVLGSRKPVAFVEGANGSYDVSLYRALLTDYLVVPSGSCSQVIQAVKALKNSKQLHHLKVVGIIDRDRRVQSEIESLTQHGIYTLDVAEVENLFCVPEIIKLVSLRLERDPAKDIDSVKSFVISKISQELEKQISLHAASEIKHRLHAFDSNAVGVTGLKTSLSDLVNEIDIDKIYADSEKQIKNAVDNNEYLEILKLYNRKSLASQISSHLGLAKGELAELVVRIANGTDSTSVKKCLEPYFSAFFK